MNMASDMLSVPRKAVAFAIRAIDKHRAALKENEHAQTGDQK